MKTYTVDQLFSEIPGDSANVLLTFPPEILESVFWKEGDILNLSASDGIITITRIDPTALSGS